MNSEELIKSIKYSWIAGSMPPPHHYEYTITIHETHKGTIIFYPDYSSEKTPKKTEEFDISKKTYADLLKLMKKKKIF